VSVAAFISSQRAEHRVPHATACRALGVSPSWFYKWADRPPSPPRQRRRAELTAAVRAAFDASGGTYGSPRITAELQAAGWQVSKRRGFYNRIGRHSSAEMRSPIDHELAAAAAAAAA